MNRRQFLAHTSSAVAFSLLGSRAAAAERRRRKPNLLFVWTDQQRADSLRVYNPGTFVQAPNLNAFAAQAVAFSQSYVTHPVCTPSRSSVMTGLWPHQSGCTGNNRRLPATTKCFPELLADPEYRTGYIGKWHLGDEIFAQHGFEEWVGTEDGYDEFYSPGRDPNARSAYHEFLVSRGHRPDEKTGRFGRRYAVKLPLAEGKPAFQAGRAVDFMQRHRASPFILHVSYLEPHTPYLSPLGHLYKDDQSRLDETYYGDTDGDFPRRYRLKQEGFAATPAFGTEAKAREIRRQYYGNISAVDHSVGTILRELERLGLADNTIVVFTSDHGDQMSAHRLWHKEVLLQESLRVPCLVRLPGARARVVAEPVSHIDFVPTLLELLGAPVPASLSGQSLVPVLQDRQPRPARPHVFAEWSPNQFDDEAGPKGAATLSPENAKYVNESSRAVLTADGWKMWLSDVDKSQLYRLGDDPHETTNLFYRGGHREVIARLTKQIHRWQESTRDTLVLN